LEAMVKEVEGLFAAGTFERVHYKDRMNILKNKWVYRVKRRPDGTPLFKARLVIKGYSRSMESITSRPSPQQQGKCLLD